MLHHFYDGQRQAPLADQTSPVLDPSTGQPYDTSPVAGPADLAAAFASAARAFPLWRDTPPAARMRALLRLADALESAGEQFADAECRNTGKPRATWVHDELDHVVDVIRFSAGASRVPEGLAAGEYAAGHTSVLRREPVGVVAQITPWNYPVMMATWKWAPAVAAGNTVVLKPAETTPVTPLMLAELADRDQGPCHTEGLRRAGRAAGRRRGRPEDRCPGRGGCLRAAEQPGPARARRRSGRETSGPYGGRRRR